MKLSRDGMYTEVEKKKKKVEQKAKTTLGLESCWYNICKAMRFHWSLIYTCGWYACVLCI